MGAEELWSESYQGEVLGETLFGWLAEHASDPVRRTELELLTLLERTTKDLAEPVFARNGFDRGDSAASVSAATELAGAVADLPWEEFTAGILPVTDQFLAKYRELVELADNDADRTVAEAYVTHEEALASFARRSCGQDVGDPLEPIRAVPHVAAALAQT